VTLLAGGYGIDLFVAAVAKLSSIATTDAPAIPRYMTSSGREFYNVSLCYGLVWNLRVENRDRCFFFKYSGSREIICSPK
jgi:hypothetical protein